MDYDAKYIEGLRDGLKMVVERAAAKCCALRLSWDGELAHQHTDDEKDKFKTAEEFITVFGMNIRDGWLACDDNELLKIMMTVLNK